MGEYYCRADAAGGASGENNTTDATTGAWTLTEALANAVAGDTVHIKAGAYSRAGTDTPTNDGTVPLPIVFKGFNSIAGDLDSPTYNADGSLVTTNYPKITYYATYYLNAGGASSVVYRNLYFSVAGAGRSGGVVVLGGGSIMMSCYVENPSTNGAAIAINASSVGGNIIEDCDIALTGATGTYYAMTCTLGTRVIGNRIVDCPGAAILVSGSNCIILDNVFFEAAVGPCIDFTGNSSSTITVRGNTARGKAIGVRFGNTAYTGMSYIGDNHFTDMSTAAVLSLYDGTAQLAAWFSHNRFRDNAADVDGFDGWYAAGAGNIASGTTGDPATDYTDYAANLFTLVTGAPGKGAASVKNRDIGALQGAGGGGGSGNIFGSVVK